jgi:hypothetical protein
MTSTLSVPVRECFVDEAGDGNLFNARGQVLLGRQGCSRHFMLGLLEVEDRAMLDHELAVLMESIRTDTRGRNIVSMQLGQGRTPPMFHATDDLPEVRLEVLRLLARQPVRFHAVVRDKRQVLEYVLQRNRIDNDYRYQPAELYSSLAERLLQRRLRVGTRLSVCLAMGGHADRARALSRSMSRVKQRFESRCGARGDTGLQFRRSNPCRAPALQALDYFLWALQRRLERDDGEALALLWPKVGWVCTMDERADDNGTGTWYTQRNPLSQPLN